MIKDISELLQRRHAQQTGVIYCLSKADCEEVAAALSAEGTHAEYYHAGLPPEERESVQQRWMNDEVKVRSRDRHACMHACMHTLRMDDEAKVRCATVVVVVVTAPP